MNQPMALTDGYTFCIAGTGTEYPLCAPYLLPEAVDPIAMQAAANQSLDQHPCAALSRAASRARSAAAFMLLCVGRAAQAEAILREVISAQMVSEDDVARVSSELRLVQVLQRLDRLDEAVSLASQVVERLQPNSLMRHFALHHLGKALVQTGAYDNARTVLSEALSLRQALGKSELIASTLEALSLLPSEEQAAQHPYGKTWHIGQSGEFRQGD
ncbi:tetratricopeptide repeat protein [Aeromonas veronii]|uniref:tetratricopeptide repeat protein n=1 Tax=Aeromonas veronii TaxID=654 RepID=UPI00191CD845|nr:tetratricopeptide repeat protein [Aeromonas veronii]MBL0473083.1 tetratricopeptide repeat protein [Aeromonas veronii]MDD1846465.1 tetratricopeptide repeat protein [Aeromonas veronii]